MPAEPATLNPVFSNYSNLRIIGGMFTPLVGFDKQTLEPNDTGLFTSWERTSDTEWTFTLRDGVTFQDGTPWDQQAAIFTIEKYRDEEKSGFRPYHSRITAIDPVGTNQIKVTTSVPYNALPKVFTNDMGISPTAYGTDGDAFGRSPVGTGPFEFGEMVSGQKLSLVASPTYFGEKPKLEGIDYTWAQDPSTRVALLQSGSVDVVYDVPVESVDAVDSAENLHMESTPTLYKMTLSLNTNSDPLSDVRLREAVQSAVDYDGITKALFADKGAEVTNLFAGDVMNVKPDITFQHYDPDKAKQLVAEVGGSPKLRFLYTTGYYPKDKQVGEAVSAMLEAAGFQVEQVPLENAEMRKERNTGNYSLYMAQNFPVFAHPDSLYAYFTGSAAAVKFCNDPAGYDALQQTALSTRDQNVSDQTYVKIEEKFLDEDRCAATLYDQVAFYGLSDKLQGFETAKDSVPDVALWSLSN